MLPLPTCLSRRLHTIYTPFDNNSLTMATAASVRITATFRSSSSSSRRVNNILRQRAWRTYIASHQVSGMVSWDRTFGHCRDPLPLPMTKGNMVIEKSASSLIRQTHNEYTTAGIPPLSSVLHWIFVSMRAFTKV